MGYAAIGLHSPKFDVNVGAVLRAAGCYGAKMVAYTGRRYKKSGTDTAGCYANLPLIHAKDLFEVIPHGCVPVAVDIVPHAVSLVDFVHPRSAFYIFGPEDGTLGSKTLDWCKHVVYVPTSSCMNLAASVNVVLYDRMAKLERKKSATKSDDHVDCGV